MPKKDEGSAPLESIFAMTFLVFLALGVIQVAFILYGRNVILSATHEGARAGVELGRNPAEAAAVARSTIARSAGGMVDTLDVDVAVDERGEESVLHVSASGTLRAFGPIPLGVPVEAEATATLERSAL